MKANEVLRLVRISRPIFFKRSFLANKELQKHNNYLGKRIKSGLFRSGKSGDGLSEKMIYLFIMIDQQRQEFLTCYDDPTSFYLPNI